MNLRGIKSRNNFDRKRHFVYRDEGEAVTVKAVKGMGNENSVSVITVLFERAFEIIVK